MTPLVVDGVLYVTAVNEVHALDAATAGACGSIDARARRASRATPRRASTAAWRWPESACSW
jgi:glucose dehydrogenase